MQILKEKFSNTYQLCNGDINKFMLLLRKGVYPYEYMGSWEKCNETKLPSPDKFYSNLHLKYISKYDYKHAQKVWNAFKIKNLAEYHALYVQLNALQLADIFEILETYA